MSKYKFLTKKKTQKYRFSVNYFGCIHDYIVEGELEVIAEFDKLDTYVKENENIFVNDELFKVVQIATDVNNGSKLYIVEPVDENKIDQIDMESKIKAYKDMAEYWKEKYGKVSDENYELEKQLNTKKKKWFKFN